MSHGVWEHRKTLGHTSHREDTATLVSMLSKSRKIRSTHIWFGRVVRVVRHGCEASNSGPFKRSTAQRDETSCDGRRQVQRPWGRKDSYILQPDAPRKHGRHPQKRKMFIRSRRERVSHSRRSAGFTVETGPGRAFCLRVIVDTGTWGPAENTGKPFES
jgi:hypothetical protein